MTPPQSIIALIPARAGSKRILNKNIRALRSHPLIAYSIHAARESRIFSRVIVSTDSVEIADIAKKYGAEVPFLRPAEYALDRSPDIEWIQHLLLVLRDAGGFADCFSILRPTNPFRTPSTICRAWRQFQSDPGADSLRAVERCAQHPAKMWIINGNRMTPVMANPDSKATPWHSTPYQALPEVYVQNASLEIAYSWIPLERGTIAGEVIMPFITEGHEGFDINRPEDWIIAEHMVREGLVALPDIPL